MASEKKCEFEIIQGKNNIILVAPHGYMGGKKDDEYTAELTKEIQRKLNCYAVINDVYRKPRKGESWYDARKKICDLNKISTYENEVIYDQFIGTIKIYKDEIFTEHKTAYIFHIHGASSKKFYAARKKLSPSNWRDVSILIGTGRNEKNNRLTASKQDVEKFCTVLKREGLVACSTDDRNFAAWSKDNLNQLFKTRYPDDNVISFQLEICKNGFRDTEDNVEAAAGKLARAISKLSGVEIGPCEKKTQPAEAEILSPTNEGNPDNALVEEAYSKLAVIFFSHYQNALMEAGRYIIDTFYDGDIELARQKKPVKDHSYTQLVKRLQEQKSDSPKKSWLFNAVNLVIQEYDFKSVQALGQLNTTQKLLLLTVHDPDLKQSLAEESIEKGYTTRQLADVIKNKKQNRKKTLISYLKKPEVLFDQEHDHLYSRKALAGFKPKQLKSIKKKAQLQIEVIQEKITEQLRYIEQYQALIEAVETVGNNDGGEPDKDNIKNMGYGDGL